MQGEAGAEGMATAAGWGAPDAGARPFHRLLDRAARATGGRLLLEPRYRYLGLLAWPDGTTRPVFGSALGLNSDAAAHLAADKTYTADLLAQAGLPVARGCLIVSDTGRAELALKNSAVAGALPRQAEALRFAQDVGYPLFLKPNRGSEGAGVSRAETAADLSADLTALARRHTHMRLEEARPGLDLRVLVLAGRARLAYGRLPVTVTGDGLRTVAELIAAHLQDLAARHRGAKLSAQDPRLLRAVSAQGATMDSVLPEGDRLVLLPGANLSTGGALTEETDRLPPETAAMAEAAARALGLTWAGVDLLLPCPQLGPEGATVLEVNSAPGLDFYASSSPAAEARALDVLRAAVALLRP